MRTWVRAGLVAAAAAGLAAGCGGPAAPEVTVADATHATLDAAVKAHKGEVVLVDFWATWCGPCLDMFPHVVGMHRRYAARGLACISVSLDKPYAGPEVRAFLRDQGATFENFHWKTYREPDQWKLFGEHFKSVGKIPHQVLFDRTGALVWDSSSEPLPSERAFDELIRRLLDGR